MRIVSFTMKSYSGIGPDGVTIDFASKHAALCGPNNSGKSALLSAIALIPSVLGGQPFSRSQGGDTILLQWTPNIASLTDDLFYRGSEIAHFSLTFTAPKRDFSVSLEGVREEDEVPVSVEFAIRNGQKFLTSITANEKPYFRMEPLARPQPFRTSDIQHLVGLIDSIQRFAARIVVFDARRDIRSAGTGSQDLTQLTQGLGVTAWIHNAKNPNAQDRASVRRFELSRQFEREFGEFAELSQFSLSVSEQMNLNVTMEGTLLPINRIGSGIGEALIILLIAKLARLREPPIDVIAIDEPELHLHPGMQRKLIDYLAKQGVQLILATHSASVLNVVQSIGGLMFRTALVAVRGHKGITVSLVEDTRQLIGLLNEIGASPGDLLQAEKVLWVEGPIDIPVFKAWLALAPSFRNQVIAVLQVGGSAVGSDSFDVAQLKKLNPNALVVMDSEREEKGGEPESSHAKFQKSCENAGITCHLTEYRATENYFTPSSVQKVFSQAPAAIDPFQPIEDQIKGFRKRKNGAIASMMTWTDLSNTDVGRVLEEFLRR